MPLVMHHRRAGGLVAPPAPSGIVADWAALLAPTVRQTFPAGNLDILELDAANSFNAPSFDPVTGRLTDPNDGLFVGFMHSTAWDSPNFHEHQSVVRQYQSSTGTEIRRGDNYLNYQRTQVQSMDVIALFEGAPDRDVRFFSRANTLSSLTIDQSIRCGAFKLNSGVGFYGAHISASNSHADGRLNTIYVDTEGGWNATTNEYVCQEAGLYLVQVSAAVLNYFRDPDTELRLRGVGSSTEAFFAGSFFNANGNVTGCGATRALIELNVGDAIFYTGFNGAQTWNSVWPFTNMVAVKLCDIDAPGAAYFQSRLFPDDRGAFETGWVNQRFASVDFTHNGTVNGSGHWTPGIPGWYFILGNSSHDSADFMQMRVTLDGSILVRSDGNDDGNGANQNQWMTIAYCDGTSPLVLERAGQRHRTAPPENTWGAVLLKAA